MLLGTTVPLPCPRGPGMGFQQVLNMGFNHLAASPFPLCFSHGRQIQPQPLQDGMLRDRKGRRRSWSCCQPWAEGLGLTWEICCLGAPQSKPGPPYPLHCHSPARPCGDPTGVEGLEEKLLLEWSGE